MKIAHAGDADENRSEDDRRERHSVNVTKLSPKGLSAAPVLGNHSPKAMPMMTAASTCCQRDPNRLRRTGCVGSVGSSPARGCTSSTDATTLWLMLMAHHFARSRMTLIRSLLPSK